MKKFKLIKEYPGSPKLDTICSYKGNVWSDSNEFTSPIFNPKKYPEYWEEIIEKDYEIVSLKNKVGVIINSSTIKKEFTPESLYLKATTTICKYSSDEFKIHSVKRLSDGEI